jgi:bis(5'-nucleosyl)-tetraphosphatase (symmetrical)
MSTYVIGDIQGCFLTFKKLLAAINFCIEKDRVIVLGDAINRGPRSLETLRFLKSNEAQFELILGNHEIKALALYFNVLDQNTQNSMASLFKAPDIADLMDWLRRRPLIINEGQNIFVHAGILPSISVKEALMAAKRTEAVLLGPEFLNLLRDYFESRELDLSTSAIYENEALLTLSYLTLIRMCQAPDSMVSYSGDLRLAPPSLKPWFELRNDGDYHIYFGHWAALGYFRYKNYCCLDSGCVWGGKLCAYNLESGHLCHVDFCD